jgi:hypothetical protein
MAVVAVPAGIVSRKFPELGKSIGKIQIPSHSQPPYPTYLEVKIASLHPP